MKIWEAELIEPPRLAGRYGAALKSSKLRAILGKKRPVVTDSGVAMADRDDIFIFEGFRLDRRAGSLLQCGEDGVLTPCRSVLGRSMFSACWLRVQGISFRGTRSSPRPGRRRSSATII